MSPPALLDVVGLEKSYRLRRATLPALRGVSFTLRRGETLGIVGESGCGKSTLGRCLLRLQTVSGGDIVFDGQNITSLSMRALRPLRPRMQMVFQDSTASLNPRRRVGDLVAEPLRVHRGAAMTPAAIAQRCAALMTLVGLREDHLQRYPHEFSGGQRQRINIARALALDPDLVVADEPVSALDVSVQAQVVNLMQDLQERLGLAMIFIAHDLAVVRQVAARVAVMYLGQIVEIGASREIFSRPAHPYTAALLDAAPRVSRSGISAPLGGEPPDPADAPSGCGFRTRCPRAQPLCAQAMPALSTIGTAREVACHFPLI